MTPTEQEEALRSRGLRVTATRLAVLGAVSDHPHATTDTILGKVRHALGTASTQAVYDVLAALTHADLLHRIEPAGHPARYERRVGDNHHHLVCRTCGTVTDVDCSVGHAPCLRPADDHGFVVEEAEVIYWGLCPACRSSVHTEAAQPTI
ncbi:Fur family transcriptional regulator, ferric uptake regulator [Sanguibacter gelidistatuariae]|uniref:Fur family transcriptional regulator, ferric uptake regulator n=1 Tax=Sanguibacter gelidistatuariae TaxID=1814289 RepID=A0A1G6P363_9MICO|nr:Fur family transcriptional regulator [Sanguibacter gelidistatuariae]SDC73855.1 Fur family transcriptional regulator, ferric uptake regulator [Sanguibacter gelidistatuariae]